MLLLGKYYDYLNPVTNERTLSRKGALDLIKMLDNYNNMIECGLNSYEDKVNFVKQYFEKGDWNDKT